MCVDRDRNLCSFSNESGSIIVVEKWVYDEVRRNVLREKGIEEQVHAINMASLTARNACGDLHTGMVNTLDGSLARDDAYGEHKTPERSQCEACGKCADFDELAFQKAVELMEDIERQECGEIPIQFVTDQYSLQDGDLQVNAHKDVEGGIQIDIRHGNTHRVLSL